MLCRALPHGPDEYAVRLDHGDLLGERQRLHTDDPHAAGDERLFQLGFVSHRRTRVRVRSQAQPREIHRPRIARRAGPETPRHPMRGGEMQGIGVSAHCERGRCDKTALERAFARLARPAKARDASRVQETQGVCRGLSGKPPGEHPGKPPEFRARLRSPKRGPWTPGGSGPSGRRTRSRTPRGFDPRGDRAIRDGFLSLPVRPQIGVVTVKATRRDPAALPRHRDRRPSARPPTPRPRIADGQRRGRIVERAQNFANPRRERRSVLRRRDDTGRRSRPSKA